jgi:hypothetical protein
MWVRDGLHHYQYKSVLRNPLRKHCHINVERTHLTGWCGAAMRRPTVTQAASRTPTL